jgi:L-ascorbate metabolism protein UlaG (beta-lactamase superfamily)
MKITYYGHSCFGVNVNGKNLLFDPFISPNELAKHIDVNTVEADYILVSHGHEDHLADVQTIAQRTGAKIVSNFEIVTWFASKGLENGHPMNHGGNWEFDFGTVQYVNAIHSSTLPDGKSGGNPGGFIVKTSEGSFYFAGDTALTKDMQLFGEQNQFSFVMLPLGDNFTMGVDDAVIAAQYLQCNKIVGMHYDTFPYIVIDKKQAVNKFKEAGKDLILIEIGKTIEL